MTDLRTAAKAALEALNSIDVGYRSPSGNPLELSFDEGKCEAAITALRAALAQQEEPDSYGYASRLAVAIWEKHYKDTAPQWKPLDDLMGVLTQIDNMTSGLTRLAQQAEPVKPVATLTAQRDALLTALRRIAMASEATVCNQEWIAKTARAAIKAAEETK